MKITIEGGITRYPFTPVSTFSPPEKWSERLVRLIDPDFLSTFIPRDWVSKDIGAIPMLVAPPPQDPDAEIRDLFALKGQRDLWPTIGVEAEARYYFIVELELVLEQMRAPLDEEVSPGLTARRLLEDLADLVLADTGTVVLGQKAVFNRPRPYQIAPALAPLFFPPHPAYPSGHATQLTAMGWIMREALRTTRFERAGSWFCDFATMAGRRREIAGVHYASDTVAGQRLAQRILECYLGDNTFVRTYIAPFQRHFV